MPALLRTDYTATITHLGVMPELSSGTITSRAVSEMTLDFGGVAEDAHYGETRLSCSRVTQQYQKGTSIRNTRQISVVSQEELNAIATELELETLDPTWLGATIVLSGIPDFSHIPPSSRLQCERSGATLTVDMYNRPCHIVSKTIEGVRPGHGKDFKLVAKERRGVTAWVELGGELRLGDEMRLHIPDQRVWAP